MQQALDFTGRTLRDTGAALALQNAGNEWHDLAVGVALQLFASAGDRGALFEDVREYATQRGLAAPPSPNAWGAVCLAMSKRGLIVKTGELRSSRLASSHARAAAVWRIAPPESAA